MRKPRRLSNDELAPWVWEAKNPSPQPPPLRREGETSPSPLAGEGGESSSRVRGEASTRVKSDPSPVGEAPTPSPARGEGKDQDNSPFPLGRGVGSSPQPINWAELFGNANPVEIEVGTGKGLFLLNAALARPGTNFLGIEIVRKYQLYAATRYAIRALPNVKTACADAKAVLEHFVPPASVSAVHVYFPDPWWKARHKKRRVFTAEFAALAARAIVPGGRLYIASDVEEYFGVMTAIVAAMPAFAVRPEEEDRAAPRTEAGFATNFERKALEGGGAVWRAVYERTGEPYTLGL